MDNSELRELLAKATPGEWMLATSCSWRRILTTEHKPVIVPSVQRSDGHLDLDCGTDYVNAELAIAAVNELPRLLADSDELASLRARIAAKATEWRERRTHADALDKACGGERFAYTAAGMEWCAGELDALLRLPVGEGQ